jgi:hypothetical protein
LRTLNPKRTSSFLTHRAHLRPQITPRIPALSPKPYAVRPATSRRAVILLEDWCDTLHYKAPIGRPPKKQPSWTSFEQDCLAAASVEFLRLPTFSCPSRTQVRASLFLRARTALRARTHPEVASAPPALVHPFHGHCGLPSTPGSRSTQPHGSWTLVTARLGPIPSELYFPSRNLTVGQVEPR